MGILKGNSSLLHTGGHRCGPWNFPILEIGSRQNNGPQPELTASPKAEIKIGRTALALPEPAKLFKVFPATAHAGKIGPRHAVRHVRPAEISPRTQFQARAGRTGPGPALARRAFRAISHGIPGLSDSPLRRDAPAGSHRDIRTPQGPDQSLSNIRHQWNIASLKKEQRPAVCVPGSEIGERRHIIARFVEQAAAKIRCQPLQMSFCLPCISGWRTTPAAKNRFPLGIRRTLQSGAHPSRKIRYFPKLLQIEQDTETQSRKRRGRKKTQPGIYRLRPGFKYD